MPSRRSRSEARVTQQEGIKSRNRILGAGAVGAILLTIVGGILLATSNNKSKIDIGGTDPVRYTYSDGTSGPLFPTVWGNSSVIDTSVEILPRSSGYVGGSVDADAVRDANGRLIGCNVFGIQISENYTGELRDDIVRKEAATAAVCDELGGMGLLDRYDTHGQYGGGGDAGLALIKEVIDGRTAALMLATDRGFGDRSGIAPALRDQYIRNYEPGVMNCAQARDYFIMRQAGQIAQQQFPPGFLEPCLN
jgi:hypothetical protein